MMNLTMKRSGPRLKMAAQDPGDPWEAAYGLPLLLQISPTEAAVMLNRRVINSTINDFEHGTDVIVFDSLDRIGERPAMPLARSERITDPKTGEDLILVCYTGTGGFVPRGALLEDGSPHPGAGTGFSLALYRDIPAEPDGPKPPRGTRYHYFELVQFRYDGKEITVTDRTKVQPDELLPGYRILNRGLGEAVPDGADLLFGVNAGPMVDVPGRDDQKIEVESYAADPVLGRNHGSGVLRFRFDGERWQPVTMHHTGVADMAFEQSLVPMADRSLLMTLRGRIRVKPRDPRFEGLEDTIEDIQVYRSCDHGETWQRVLRQHNGRSATPITIGHSPGGQPILIGNPFWRDDEVIDTRGRVLPSVRRRHVLSAWPLHPSGEMIAPPVTLLHGERDLGPVPDITHEHLKHDNIWLIDHPRLAQCRLADGQWHTLAGFRVTDGGVHAAGTAPLEQAGAWIEEIHSDEPEKHEVWRFGSA